MVIDNLNCTSVLPSVSKALLVFYHRCCSLIGLATRYLVLNSQ